MLLKKQGEFIKVLEKPPTSSLNLSQTESTIFKKKESSPRNLQKNTDRLSKSLENELKKLPLVDQKRM